MKNKLPIIILAVIIFAFTIDNAYAQIAVISNKYAKTGSIDQSRLLDIYTLNSQQWDDGYRIRVMDFKGNKPIKIAFYNYMGIKPSEMQKIWLRKQFSGKAIPPTTFNSEEDILDKVASTPGAIGYISADKVNEDVKVLMVIQ
jgi:ABC-type phosphate transport system substrate-binding protein